MKRVFSAETSRRPVSEEVDIFHARLRQMQAEFNLYPADIDDPEWVKVKLQHMFDIDQFCIRSCEEFSGSQNIDGSLDRAWDTWRGVNHQNLAALKQIIDRHGWPVISKFGRDADNRAWLIVQHADNDVQFQRCCLTLLEKLHPVGETAKDNYAYLYDRVQINSFIDGERLLQRFGTQGDMVDGKWQPFPIEDPDNVDMRRAQFKIFPPRLADYTHLMNLETDARRNAFMETLKPLPVPEP